MRASTVVAAIALLASTAFSNNIRCGYDFQDANSKCGAYCGVDSNVCNATGEKCFKDLTYECPWVDNGAASVGGVPVPAVTTAVAAAGGAGGSAGGSAGGAAGGAAATTQVAGAGNVPAPAATTAAGAGSNTGSNSGNTGSNTGSNNGANSGSNGSSGSATATSASNGPISADDAAKEAAKVFADAPACLTTCVAGLANSTTIDAKVVTGLCVSQSQVSAEAQNSTIAFVTQCLQTTCSAADLQTAASALVSSAPKLTAICQALNGGALPSGATATGGANGATASGAAGAKATTTAGSSTTNTDNKPEAIPWNNMVFIIALLAVLLAFAAFIILMLCCCHLRKKKEQRPAAPAPATTYV
ncbi:hypothetical protein HDU79_011142 [Rhizoclosmatium sp. JEL0117]|nr:hypothetical protein HDU79_011142 [Rhizoclosmatium sp. JEL0117]